MGRMGIIVGCEILDFQGSSTNSVKNDVESALSKLLGKLLLNSSNKGSFLLIIFLEN